ncbi:putative sulfate transporter [Saezia sanguinis]|uniref:Putative sulfate transporter n=2 Tax=Saezia sanguinis TaxID=1965230 RepID=A0A433SGW3_9BURK|nr:putative sulfate transporter [Saezia sanguinis]
MEIKLFQKIIHMLNWIGQWIPGLPELLRYDLAYFKNDLFAGLSVAAVALPTSIAYAQLAGLPPQAGLYSTILPMIIYTFLGSSRQLIVGPDAATCAMISSTLMPIVAAGSNPEYYQSLVFTLTLLAGILFIVAGFLRLGFLADLQSRSILLGLMNGVAVMIIIGQLGNVIGVAATGKDTIGKLMSFIHLIPDFHWLTLLLSGTLFALYYVMQRYPGGKKVPSILVIAIVAVILSMVFSLSTRGVNIVGEIPSALPDMTMPALPPHEQWGSLFFGAIALVFVSFISATLTAHTFAAKNNYEVDDNKELIALGVADMASAICQGFAISGADSRTAVNEAAGGKTRFAQLIAALTILGALVLFIEPMGYMPLAALGVILICSAIKLTNFSWLFKLRKISKTEFFIAMTTFLSVLLLGVIHAVILAIFLAILSFLRKTARPVDHCLGLMPDDDNFYETDHHPEAQEVPGLLLYRFDASLIFLNASYFRQRVLSLVRRTDISPVQWVVIDGHSINNVDLTGVMTLSDLGKFLAARGIALAFADHTNHMKKWLQTHNIDPKELSFHIYPNRYEMLVAYRDSLKAQEDKGAEAVLQSA